MTIDLLANISLDIDYSHCPEYSKNLFIADITGNDSIAALINTVELHLPDFVIPSVINIGCEFGNKDQSQKTVNKISEIYRDTPTHILPGIFLDINLFWKKFIAKSINFTIDKYKFFSPCISCHLIMHLSRIKLAQHFNAIDVISGEREFHSNREKINQLDFVLDFYNTVYDSAGIRHHTPIRHIKDNQEINRIVDGAGIEAIKLNCLFSGTYYDNAGQIVFNKNDIRDYVLNHLASLIATFSEPIVIKCTSIK